MDNPQPAPAAPKPDDTPLQTKIVTNIPIHLGGNQQPAVANQHDDSKIMRDVGDQLAKEDQSKPKHHLFSKAQSPSPAKPNAPILPPKPTPNAPQASPQPATAKPTSKQPAKPKSNVPIAAITITLVVTGALIFLAYSSFK